MKPAQYWRSFLSVAKQFTFPSSLEKNINMRTPEGTPNKSQNPPKLTSSYFSTTKYVRQNVRSYLRNIRFLLWNCEEHPQPRSQGLSSLPLLDVGRKTLVAAGHMTTQNLGGK